MSPLGVDVLRRQGNDTSGGAAAARHARLALALALLSLTALLTMGLAAAPSGAAAVGEGTSSASRHAAYVPAAVARALPSPGVPTLAAFARPVPILMYHVIDTAPPGAAYPGLFVTARQFADEVGWLAANGYQAVTLSQLLAGWQGRASLPPKPVVLTFDDGYGGDFRNAAPLLRRYGWPGVLNLALTHLGPHRDLTSRMVEQLLQDGWELASHTMTHADLVTLSGTQLSFEVAGSRAVLQRTFHVPVFFFCYPSGQYDAATVRAVQQAGYLGALTTQPGLADPRGSPYTLARVRVDPGESLAQFAAGLKLGYAP